MTFSHQSNKDSMATTGLGKSIKISMTAGIAEILINHPLWVMKTRKQCGYPFRMHPQILYKGITYHAASEVLLSVLQITGSIQVEEWLTKQSFSYAGMAGSMISGAFSGVVTSPTELIMTQQQKLLKNNIIVKKDTQFFTIATNICLNYGPRKLFDGSLCAVIRESLYVWGYYSGTSLLGNYFKPYIGQHYVSSLLAGGVSGMMTTVVTHPFDTIKTMQQAQVFNKKKLSIFEASKNIYRNNGFKGFFSGIVERGVRNVSATAIVGCVIESMRPTY